MLSQSWRLKCARQYLEVALSNKSSWGLWTLRKVEILDHRLFTNQTPVMFLNTVQPQIWNFIAVAFYTFIYYKPIAVAALSKARTVFARSNTEIVGSNPTSAWMFLCAFFLFLHSLKWDYVHRPDRQQEKTKHAHMEIEIKENATKTKHKLENCII
jgi:hypothetical protein